MDEPLLNLVLEIKQLIKNCSLDRELKEAESCMENDEEVILLTSKKDFALERYNNALSYLKKDDPELENIRLDFVDAKTKLYEHPKVKKYNDIYGQLRRLYYEINQIIFDGFELNMCPNK